MADGLTNARAKLDRADEHLRELRDEIQAFANTEPYSVVNEERAADLDVARIWVRDYPPLKLGLIFGDVLGNWRSALDNLANDLVRLNGRDPGAGTSFPIFSDPGDFDRRGANRIRGVSQEHAAIITGLQPFQNDWDPTIQALLTLNKYVNADKHRAIHATLTAITEAHGYAASLRRADNNSEFSFEVDPVGFDRHLEHGLEIAHIKWQQPVPIPKPQMTGEFPVEIAFGQDGLRFQALPEIRWHIHVAVECFASDFGEPMNLLPLTDKRE
jgi:hypothetical protein